jgi:putative hydrolase of the HAD superfamily
VSDLVKAYREHIPDISLAPDAETFLRRLAVPVFALTDGPLASQRKKAHALGLDRWVAHVVFTAEHGPGFHKPSPAGFELIQSLNGDAPASHVYVADNPAKDFLGPRHLGWQTVRIRREGSLWEHTPTDGSADIELPSLEALLVGI